MAAGQNFADAATAACVWSTLLNNKPLLPFRETLSHHPPPWPSSASASTSEGPTRTSSPTTRLSPTASPSATPSCSTYQTARSSRLPSTRPPQMSPRASSRLSKPSSIMSHMPPISRRSPSARLYVTRLHPRTQLNSLQHFVNALVERNRARLDRVAVIRLCGPFTHGTPPFVGFPLDLKNSTSFITVPLDDHRHPLAVSLERPLFPPVWWAAD